MGNTDVLSFNKDYYTVISNEFIMAKHETPLQCARLIRFVIANIILHDKELKTYTCKIAELADFLGISRTNMYHEIDTLTDQLMSSFVQIRNKSNPDKWDKFQLVARASSDGQGKITIRLSEEIKPYVLALSSKYTQYQLRNILEFSSLYSIRLYEILKSESNRLDNDKVKLSVARLREILNCETKYEKFRDFKRRVIDTAIGDINNYTDISVEVEYFKKEKSRSVSDIIFFVRFNYDPENENSIVSRVIHKREEKGEKFPPSTHMARLLDYLKKNLEDGETTLFISVEELRTVFECENKYVAFKDFKRRIIEPTIAEINKKTYICVDVEYIKKKGVRGISGVGLSISPAPDSDVLDFFVPNLTDLR